jgi:Mn-containing catalase
MLLNTGTEEIGHIEMLATAVALNLEGAPAKLQESAADGNAAVAAALGGQDPRHVLSSGLGAMAVDANGVPFSGAYVVATGNLAADMHANVTAEGGGRVLATRLYEMTDDPGMKEMLSFLIARDTMHQNQWMAVLEELKDMGMPVPADFPQEEEKQEFSCTFLLHSDAQVPDDARWASGPSVDGHGEFEVREAEPGAAIRPSSRPPRPGRSCTARSSLRPAASCARRRTPSLPEIAGAARPGDARSCRARVAQSNAGSVAGTANRFAAPAHLEVLGDEGRADHQCSRERLRCECLYRRHDPEDVAHARPPHTMFLNQRHQEQACLLT